MGNEVKIALQWCVVGRQWGLDLRSSRRFRATTGKCLRREWRYTEGIHRITSKQYLLQLL